MPTRTDNKLYNIKQPDFILKLEKIWRLRLLTTDYGVLLQERGYAVASCGRDGGRPTGIGHQRLVSNHLRRLLSKAMVVSA